MTYTFETCLSCQRLRAPVRERFPKQGARSWCRRPVGAGRSSLLPRILDPGDLASVAAVREAKSVLPFPDHRPSTGCPFPVPFPLLFSWITTYRLVSASRKTARIMGPLQKMSKTVEELPAARAPR